MTISREAGLLAQVQAKLVDLSVLVTIGVSSKAAQLDGRPKFFFNATTTAPASLTNTVKALWPGMPATASSLLKQASLGKLQAAYDTTSGRLSIAAYTVGSTSIDSLEDLADHKYALSYESPSVVFLTNPAYLKVGVTVDIPSIKAKAVAATLEVSSATSELQMQASALSAARSKPAGCSQGAQYTVWQAETLSPVACFRLDRLQGQFRPSSFWTLPTCL
jgi:hypothetical protein